MGTIKFSFSAHATFTTTGRVFIALLVKYGFEASPRGPVAVVGLENGIDVCRNYLSTLSNWSPLMGALQDVQTGPAQIT